MTQFTQDHIVLKHGAGGRAMRQLIQSVFLRGAEEWQVDGIGLTALDDGAALRLGDGYLVITTDSHVVQPRFFPGGDIGRLAISGTVNDLAVMGATKVLGLTCAVILEEGLERSELERVQQSMRDTCREAGVAIVTGDTKVMGRGELDGLVINTTGVGLCRRPVSDAGLRPNDRILVTGTLADHGFAVLAARKGLELGGDLRSDVAPIGQLVAAALEVGGERITAMKDPTRGGVAGALHEMAAKANVGVVLDEAALPLTPAVRAAAELLGIDPLHVASEGKAVLGVAPHAAAEVLAALHRHPQGRDARIIGTATDQYPGRVVLDTGLGLRIVNELEGEPLPRIC